MIILVINHVSCRFSLQTHTRQVVLYNYWPLMQSLSCSCTPNPPRLSLKDLLKHTCESCRTIGLFAIISLLNEQKKPSRIGAAYNFQSKRTIIDYMLCG